MQAIPCVLAVRDIIVLAETVSYPAIVVYAHVHIHKLCTHSFHLFPFNMQNWVLEITRRDYYHILLGIIVGTRSEVNQYLSVFPTLSAPLFLPLSLLPFSLSSFSSSSLLPSYLYSLLLPSSLYSPLLPSSLHPLPPLLPGFWEDTCLHTATVCASIFVSTCTTRYASGY